MLCISPAQRSRSGVTRGGSRCWCCSQPPAASLENQLFALKGFALHREPNCRRNTPTLPKPSANSTLRTATSSSRAQLVSNTLEMGTSDGPAPAPSPPPGPSRAVLRGLGQQYLWLCVQGRGAADSSLPCVPEDESDRFGPEESRVTCSDRSICLRQTNGQAPAPSVSTVTSCHQRSGRALTDKQRARPVTLSDS